MIRISSIVRYTPEEAQEFAVQAAIAAGAGEATARALASATVAAELHGRPSVGFAHLPDYLDGLEAGRIAGRAEPGIDFPTPAAIRVDAKGGIAQFGFDRAFDALLERTGLYGMAVFMQHNSYAAGELGYYTRRLAEAGLVALAASNGPALLTAGAGPKPVYGTNPMASQRRSRTRNLSSSIRRRAQPPSSMCGARRKWERRFPPAGPSTPRVGRPPMPARR